jgi:hypothetical protein
LIIAALAQIASVASPTQVAAGDGERREVTETMSIPDEIAPAIVPYLRCLYASHGVPMGSRDGQLVVPPVAKGASCLVQRRAASDLADQLLIKAGGRTAEERAAFVEAHLKQADAFATRYSK